MNNLAVSLYCEGRYDEAADLHRECFERRKVELGDDHPDTLETMLGLADSLFEIGQGDEAVESRIADSVEQACDEGGGYGLELGVHLFERGDGGQVADRIEVCDGGDHQHSRF